MESIVRLVRWVIDLRKRYSRAYNIGRIVLGLVSSGVLGWLAVTGLSAREIGEAFSSIPVYIAVAGLAVFILANVIAAYRWQILFLTERVPLARLFLVRNAGIGLNNLMPVRAFSEATQFAILTTREKVSGGTVLATLGVERGLDIVASTFLLALGLILIPQFGSFVPQMVFAIVVTLGWVGAIHFFAWGSEHVKVIMRGRLLSALGRGIAAIERRPRRMAAAMLFTLCYWFLLGISGWIIGIGMGLGAELGAMIMTVVVMTFFTTSTLSLPGAVGTFEFAVVYMLKIFGVDGAEALSFAIVLHAIFYLPPIVIALIYLPREGLSILKGGASKASSKGNVPAFPEK